MNWPALNERMCGVLIDFSLEKGVVLFLKERIRRGKEQDRKEIAHIMEIGNYFSIYLEEKSKKSKNPHVLLMGRLDDLYWKSSKAIEDEYGVDFGDFEKEIKIKSTSVITSAGFEDTMPINLLGNPHAIGQISFLDIPKKIPNTWMKVFEASEEDVRNFLKGSSKNTGFKMKIAPERWVSVDFQEKHLLDNILIIGSYKDFLSLAFRQILKFSNLPKIIFARETDTGFSDFQKISIHEFQRLVSNGFGFEYATDEQILNAATALSPPQIRLLSNLLDQANGEKKEASKLETLKGIINKNLETQDDRYSEDLEKILDFLKTKDTNLSNLIGNDKITAVDVSNEGESKQIVFSKLLHAIRNEIDNRKRKNAPFLKFIIIIEDIEDYIPSNFQKELNSDEIISKEAFEIFVSHPDTKRIGLIMSTRFPSRIDPLIYYLCPNRLFGNIFEKRELIKIKEFFGIEEIEIRKLRDTPEKGDGHGILLNFPSRFPVDTVDGILIEER